MSDQDIKAADLFRKSAKTGDPEAQFEFAKCLRDGRGVPQDLSGATDWFHKAAGAGHQQAAQELEKLHPSQPSPSQPPASGTSPAQGEGAGLGCAVIAGVVGLIVFANSCTITLPGGFFSSDTKETNWPAALFCTAIVTAIAYNLGKKTK